MQQPTCYGPIGWLDRNERRRCDACAERVPARHKRMTKRATCRLGADRELGTGGHETGIARKEAGLVKRRSASRSTVWRHHSTTCGKQRLLSPKRTCSKNSGPASIGNTTVSLIGSPAFRLVRKASCAVDHSRQNWRLLFALIRLGNGFVLSQSSLAGGA